MTNENKKGQTVDFSPGLCVIEN